MKKKLILLLTFIIMLSACEGDNEDIPAENSAEIEVINFSENETNEIHLIESITITKEGKYILTGEISNGMVLVEADDDADIELVLKNVKIANSTGSAIFIKSAGNAKITLEGENVISDTENTETSGAIHSKCNLTLGGHGKMTITAAKNAVASKTDLIVESGEYIVSSVNHGLKSQTNIKIDGGTFMINSTEDALHSNGDIEIHSGAITIDAGDDGIHADNEVNIYGGDILINKSNEGVESASINILGGYINLTSSDDGMNVSGGSDDETDSINLEMPEMNGEPPENMPEMNGERPEMPENMAGNNRGGGKFQNGFGGGFGGNVTEVLGTGLDISGGYVIINAGGDGLDSNGYINITGGTVIINGSEGGGDSALDYETTATVSGGTVIAAGMSQMAMSLSSETQCVLASAITATDKNTRISLTDESNNIIASFVMPKKFDHIVVSSDMMSVGKTYLIQSGGETENIDEHGFGNTGTLKNGITLTSVEQTDLNIGSSFGGFGGNRAPRQ